MNFPDAFHSSGCHWEIRSWRGEEKPVWCDPSNHFQKEVLGCLIGSFSKSYWTWFGIRFYFQCAGYMHCMMVKRWRWWILVGLDQPRIVSVSAAARELKCCWIFLFNKWKVLPWMDFLSLHCHPTYSSNDTLCHMNTARNLFMKACYLHKWYTYIYIYILHSTWDICGYPIASQAGFPKPSEHQPQGWDATFSKGAGLQLMLQLPGGRTEPKNTARENVFFFFSSFGEWFF